MKAEWTNKDSLTPDETTKAILVINRPMRCGDCLCYQCGFCLTNFGMVNIDDKPADWCPLKLLPQPIWHEEGKENECEEWYKNGWNDCLEELEK